MKWVLIAAGVLMAASAMGIFMAYATSKACKSKKQVSRMAKVNRVGYSHSGEAIAEFLLGEQTMQFVIPDQMGQELKPGQQGILTHRGNEFVYFVPRRQPGIHENQWQQAG